MTRTIVITENVNSKWQILPQNTHFGQIFEYQLQNHKGLRAKIFRDWSFRHYLQTRKVWEVIVSCPAWFDMELPVTLIVNNVKNTYVSGVFPSTLLYHRFCVPNWVCKRLNAFSYAEDMKSAGGEKGIKSTGKLSVFWLWECLTLA